MNEITYYNNPSDLLKSNFIDHILDSCVKFTILHPFSRHLVFLLLSISTPIMIWWFILDLFGNVLDYITYHYSVSFILWGYSKEEKLKAMKAMKAKKS